MFLLVASSVRTLPFRTSLRLTVPRIDVAPLDKPAGARTAGKDYTPFHIGLIHGETVAATVVATVATSKKSRVRLPAFM